MRLVAAQAKVLPIMVGSLSPNDEQSYSDLLYPLFAREDTIFVVSSDFCHWGKNFDYKPLGKDPNQPIWKFVEEMDLEGVNIASTLDSKLAHQIFQRVH